MREKAAFIAGPNGRLAYRRIEGAAPEVVWLGGFKSDMTGTKAAHLADWAAKTGRAYLRFDYSGHGASDGAFEDGCISDWTADALAAIDQLTQGPLILVGSSMGGWIATLIALNRPDRIAGVVTIAPAPDFTEDLIWAQMSAADRETITRDGRLLEASQYADEPTPLTLKLIEDGRKNLVLRTPIAIHAPVRILQGMRDPDVPWRHALKLAEALETDDLEISLVKTGDHRLSTTADLARLTAAIESIPAG